jgi:murein L,D-transpeptidase YafK
VEKRSQQAALYEFKNGFKEIELLKTYHISSGQAQGNKYVRGDLKTPEGLYNTIKWIPEKKLEAKYGSGAFVLDYPNQLDKLLKKTGSGIWIHGSDIAMIPFDTEGCIRFENQEITHFKEELNFDRVPVLINETFEWTDITALEKEIEGIQSFLKEWEESWARQDINKYLSFYSPTEFVTNRQKMDYAQWENHKRRIFNPNKQINIELTDFEYYYADNLLLVSFYQDYTAETLKSMGWKQIVLRRTLYPLLRRGQRGGSEGGKCGRASLPPHHQAKALSHPHFPFHSRQFPK